MPGSPGGKPAGVACLHLSAGYRCLIYTSPERPAVCARFAAEPDACGQTREHAMVYLAELKRLTAAAMRDPCV